MKIYILPKVVFSTLFFIICSPLVTAQTALKIGQNNNSINSNAVFELESANKGFLLPRVALSDTANVAPLAAHVQGMTVYNTATTGNVTPGYYFNDGTQWIKLGTDTTGGNLILNNVSLTSTVLPAGSATGHLQYNTNAAILPVGPVFWNGASWISIVDTASNGITKTALNDMQLGGALTQNTTIADLSATNKLNLTGTGVDAFNVDANTLSVDFTNNRVGIGTAIPGVNLQISGNPMTTSIETNELLRLHRIGTPGTRNDVSAGVRLGSHETGADGKGRLDFMVSGLPGSGNSWGSNPNVNVMTLNGNGFVGIGTIAPAGRLHLFGNNSKLVIDNGAGAVSEIGIDFRNGDSTGSEPKSAIISKGYNNWKRADMHFVLDGALDAGPYDINTDTKLLIKAESGNVGIGTITPVARLDVATGVTTTNTVVNATGSIDDFLQFNIQNTSAGTKAQSGYSATANNGTLTTGFAWMGINNSTFNFPTAYNIGGANDVTYVGSGQDMYIANANNTKSIIFSTGKAAAPFFDERMRITNSGNVGIGTGAPTERLHVAGNLRLTGAIIDSNNQVGTAGQVLSTTVTGIDWIDVSTIASVNTASNGVKIVGSTVKLGGALDEPTTIFVNDTNKLSIDGTGVDIFNVDTNTLSVDGTNHSVGIGTANPTERLHVEGSLRLTAALYDKNNNPGNVGQFLQSTATGTNWVNLSTISGARNGLNLQGTNIELGGGLIKATTISDLTTTNKLRFEGTGEDIFNVADVLSVNATTASIGIGTTTPTAKLHLVGGGIRLNSGLSNSSTRPALNPAIQSYEMRGSSVTSDTNDDGFLRLSAGGGTNTNQMSAIELSGASSNADMNKNIGFITSGTERMRIDEAGYVGIGTTAPTKPLHVVGKMRIVDGTQGVNKVLSSDVDGNTTWISITGTGSYAVANGLTLDSGFIKLGGSISEPTPITGITATNKLSYTGTGVDAFNLDSNTVSVDFTNDRVGIGTAAPDTKLHVVGQVKIVDGNQGVNKVLTSDIDGNASWASVAGTGSYLAANGISIVSNFFELGGALTKPTAITGITGTNKLSFSGAGIDGFNIDSNTLSVDFDNNRVGIGTNTPFGDLHLGTANSNRKIILSQATNNENEYFGFGVNTNALRYQTDATTSNHIFYAATGATTSNELMRITGTGNVGIGTANPTTKLHVNGNLRFENLGTAPVAGSILTATDGVGNVDWLPAPVVNLSGANGVNRNGNDIELGGSLTKQTTIAALTNTNKLRFTGNGTDAFNVDAGTLSVDFTNDKIGIGTTSPSEKLEVNGNLRLIGALKDSNNEAGTAGQVLSSTVTGTDWVDIPAITVTGANNGLNLDGSTTQLGGPLIEPTTISALSATNKLNLTGAGVDAFNVDAGTMSVDFTNNRVGIGTIIPEVQLQVNGPNMTTAIETSELFRLVRPVEPGTREATTVGFRVGSFETGLNGRARLDFMLSGTPGAVNNWGRTPNVNVMTLNGNGNVGIGNADPLSALDIISTSGFLSGLTIRNTNAPQDAINISQGPSDSFINVSGSENGFTIRMDNNPTNTTAYNLESYTDRFRILNNGNIGLGVSSPNAQLQFNNTNTNRKLVLWQVSNNDHEFMGLGLNANIFRYQIPATNNAHVFYAAVNGTTSNELMRIQGDGNVGIGTSAPAERLHVAGNLRLTGALLDSNNEVGTAGQVLSTTATGTDWIDYNAVLPVTTADNGLNIEGTTVELGGPLNEPTTITVSNTNKLSIAATGVDAFNIDGNTLSVDAANHNLGIGTNTPTEKLHVDGNLRLTAALYDKNNNPGSAGQYLQSTANGTNWVNLSTIVGARNGLNLVGTNIEMGGSLIKATTISGLTTTNKFRFEGIGEDIFNVADALSVNATTGNIGIGTTTPTAKLNLSGGGIKMSDGFSDATTRPGLNTTAIGAYEIRGVGGATQTDAADNGFLRLSAGGGTTIAKQSAIEISGSSTVPDMNQNISLLTSGTERMRIDQAGNVGIGTTAPTKPLHVVGKIRIEDGTQGINKVLSSDVDGNTTWISITGTGSYAVANGLTLDTGFIKLGGSLSEPTAITGITGTNKLSYTGTGVDAFNLDSNTVSVDFTNDRVGIGTAAPDTKLHVVGQVKIVDGNQGVNKVLTSDIDGNATWSSIAGTGSYLAANGISIVSNFFELGGALTKPTAITGITGTNKLSFSGAGIDGFNIDTNTLSVDFDNNRVGIGTATPFGDLHLGTGNTNRKIVLSQANNNDHEYFGFGVNTNALRYQTDATTSSHIFYAATGTTTSNELMRITGTGNVGIGNSAPAAKLHVSGSLRFDNIGTPPVAGSILTATDGVGNVDWLPAPVVNLSGANGVNRNGNDIELGGFLTKLTTISALSATNKLRFTGSGTDAFNVDGGTLSVDFTNDRVGIGSISPTEKLEVNGNLRLIGALKDSNNEAGTAGQVLSSTVTGTDWIDLNSTQTVTAADNGLNLDAATAQLGGPLIEPTTISALSATNKLNLTGAGVDAFNVDAGTLSVDFTSDRIGLGTIAPTAKLHLVGGGIRLNSGFSNTATRPVLTTTTVPGYEIRGSSSGGDAENDGFLRLSAGGGTNTGTQSAIDISGFSTVSDMDRNIRFLTSGIERMRIFNNGYVGIGTANPLARLHITGSGPWGDGILLENAGTNPRKFAIATRTDAGGGLVISDETAGIARLTLNTSGQLGIGTTTPFAPLHVASGTTNRKIVLYQGTNNEHEFAGFGINAGILRYQLDATASSHVFYAGTSGTTSNELMRITGTGRVGIGVAAPQTRLHVVGDLRFETTAAAPVAGQVLTATDNLGTAVWQTPAVAIVTAALNGTNIEGTTVELGGPLNEPTTISGLSGANTLSFTGDVENAFSVDGATFSVDAANNFIGIGTIVPTAKLNLSGGGVRFNSGLLNTSSRPSLNTTTIPAYEIRGTSGTGDNDTYNDGFLRLSAGGGTNTLQQSTIELSGFSTLPDMDKNIVFRTAGLERVRINNTGNLGIGTATPSAKLQVVGSTLIGTGTAAATALAGSASLVIDGAVSNYKSFDAGASTSIDFSKSNLAFSTASAGAFSFTGMKDGGVYTLAVQGTSSGTLVPSHTGLTFRSTTNGATDVSSGKHTLYTFTVIGTVVYYNMNTGL